MKHQGILAGLQLVLMTAAAIAAATTVAAPRQISLLKPAISTPQPHSLKPGLRVQYIHGFIRHIDEIPNGAAASDGGVLAMLDWNADDGEVMTSGREDGVAARITGLINFARPGAYVLAIQSNDGARLTIGDALVIDDPDVHPDRFSPNVTVQVEESGWYPMKLLYFERKGTSTMELYWQPPGTKGFDFVPAKAFAHRAEG